MHRTNNDMRAFLLLHGLMAALALPCAGANPNSAFGLLTTNYGTPHIVWGDPLAGGPIKTMVVAPMWTHRETVELAQRLTIEPAPVMINDYGHIAPARVSFYIGPSAEEVVRMLQEQVNRPVDVIVIGKVQWSALPAPVRAELLRKIQAGTGLVYINPPSKPTEDEDFRGILAAPGAETPEVVSAPDEKTMRLAIHRSELSAVWNTAPVTWDHFICRGLRGVPLPGLQGRTWPDLVKTGYCGKGRIVRIDWIEPAANDGKPKAGAPLRLHSLAPSGTTNDPPWAYEYYQHCLAKAVAWAARGEPEAGIRALSVPPVMERTQLAKAAIRVERLGKEAQSGQREVRLEMRACEGWTGTVVWTNRLLLSSTGQENTLSVPVPAGLAPGHYAVHAWLMYGDAVMDWAAALTEIVPGPGEPRLIQEVDMKRSACRAGEPLDGTVQLAARLPAGQYLQVSVWDWYGRRIWRERASAEQVGDRLAFAATFPLRRSLSVTVRVERFNGNDQALETRERRLPAWDAYTDDDFHLLLWSNPNGALEHRPLAMALNAYRACGVDADYDPTWNPAPDRDLEANLRVAPIVWRITGEQNPDMSSPQARQSMRASFQRTAALCQPYDPLLFSLGDETWGYGFDNFATSPSSLSAFRAWLQRSYGTIDQLNHSWQTTFERFEQVAGFIRLTEKTALPTDPLAAVPEKNGEDILEDAKTVAARAAQAQSDRLAERRGSVRSGRRARWVDQNLFQDWLCADLRRWCVDSLKGVCPRSYVGDEGSGSLEDSGQGRDWEQELEVCDIAQNYDDLVMQLDRSFAQPRSLRGFWIGNYPYRRMDEGYMRGAPWRALFQHMNSIWWWMGYPDAGCNTSSALKPDLTPIPAFRQVADSVREIRQGMATVLLKTAAPVPEPVAVLYSPASLHVGSYVGEWGRVGAAIRQAVGLLAPLNCRFVSGRQIERGVLTNGAFRVLVLAGAHALSDAQAEAVRSFVDGGGALLGDVEPGRYTEHGASRSSSALGELWAGGEPAVPRTFGKGQVLWLGQSFAGPATNDPPRWKGALAEFLRARESVCWPVPVRSEDGQILRSATVNVFTNASGLFVGIYPENRAMPVRVSLPWKGHVYDVRQGRCLGELATVPLEVSWQPVLLAVLSYPVRAVTVQGLPAFCRRGETLTGAVEIAGMPPDAAPLGVRIAVQGPDGRELPWLSQTVLVGTAPGKVALPVAENDPPGYYTCIAREVVSGMAATNRIEVR